MYLPAFPVIEVELGQGTGQAVFTLAAFFISLALGQLFYGPVSDRFGRKPPLYVGLAIYVLASLGCVLAGFGLLCLALVYGAMAETRDRRQAEPLTLGRTLATYRQLLGERGFLGYSLAAGFASAGMFAYIAGSPHVLIDIYGIPPPHFGWVFGINAVGFIAASQLNARLLRRHSLTVLLRRALHLTLLTALTTVMALCGVSAWAAHRFLISRSLRAE